MIRVRNITLFLIVASLVIGCSSENKPAIEIGKIDITTDEFNEAFDASSYAGQGKSKKEFLNNFMSRKLILREAERMGLDKDLSFLKDVQIFWEQSLLKLTLSRKIKEISTHIRVSDKEIGDYYKQNRDKTFVNKELPDVYGRIKWLLFKRKQAQAIEEWVDSLRKNTNIKVDYRLLGIEEK